MIRTDVARRPARLIAALAFAAGVGAAIGRPDAQAAAASAAIVVLDDAGAPVADAAVWLEPADGRAPPATPPGALRAATIEQSERRFQPRLTVVQSGAQVTFPNNDTVRHHVYSFSPAKAFELKLYAGTPAAPVTFDKAGTVVLGCNIHDRMVAWVQVVDTPWFGRTDAAGRLRIGPLPAGDYKVMSFHPDQRAPAAERRARIAGDGDPIELRVELKAATGSR